MRVHKLGLLQNVAEEVPDRGAEGLMGTDVSIEKDKERHEPRRSLLGNIMHSAFDCHDFGDAAWEVSNEQFQLQGGAHNDLHKVVIGQKVTL